MKLPSRFRLQPIQWFIHETMVSSIWTPQNKGGRSPDILVPGQQPTTYSAMLLLQCSTAVYRMVSGWCQCDNRTESLQTGFCLVLCFRISLITWRNTPAGESTSWRDTLSLLKRERTLSWATPNRSGTSISSMSPRPYVTCMAPLPRLYVTSTSFIRIWSFRCDEL